MFQLAVNANIVMYQKNIPKGAAYYDEVSVWTSSYPVTDCL